MKRIDWDLVKIVGACLLLLAAPVSCRAVQCRHASDKLGCWLSDRVVYVPKGRP